MKSEDQSLRTLCEKRVAEINARTNRMNGEINNRNDAISLAMDFSAVGRSSWIQKGSRKKDNENIEIPRKLAIFLADMAAQYFIALDMLPYDPTCNCREVEELLQRAIRELPDGETVDRLQQLILTHCPACGVKYA